MSTLTKQEIIEKLMPTLDLNATHMKSLVDEFFHVFIETLSDAEQMKLSGFGNFILRDKPPRPGRNPKTKESAEISARRVVTFLAGEKLRARVKDYNPDENELSDEVL